MIMFDRLRLVPEEPGDEGQPFFDILDDALQPNPGTSVTVAVDRITALLPEGRPYSLEVDIFLTTCYEIAEQVPYHHDSMLTLVTIIDLCLHSPTFPTVEGSKNADTDPELRALKLGETLTDWWNSTYPDGDPSRYENFQTFVARIYERNLLEGRDFATYTLRSAFEEFEGNIHEQREAYVRAGLQYLLLLADSIYDEAKQEAWQRWHVQIGHIAAQDSSDKHCPWKENTLEMAQQALRAMEAVKAVKPVKAAEPAEAAKIADPVKVAARSEISTCMRCIVS